MKKRNPKELRSDARVAMQRLLYSHSKAANELRTEEDRGEALMDFTYLLEEVRGLLDELEEVANQ